MINTDDYANCIISVSSSLESWPFIFFLKLALPYLFPRAMSQAAALARYLANAARVEYPAPWGGKNKPGHAP